MWCDLIFVLDNGTELKGKNTIVEHLHLFPPGTFEKVKPLFFAELQKTGMHDGWGTSVIKVYQTGKYECQSDNAPEMSDCE